jgi:hypothetical protein
MKPLTIAELQGLMAERKGPCVSLFLPTHRDHRNAAQDRIRFKNLLSEADRLLREDHDSRTARELLGPLEDLQKPSFWRDQQDGLAVFRTDGLLEQFRIPMPLPERVVVAPHFHIRPVIRFLQSNQVFYVLAISQKHVALHHATADSLAQVGVRDMPVSMEEIVGSDYRDGFSNRSSSTGGNGTTHHGSGTHDAGKKDELLRDSHAPLVLAGVGYYHPLYRSINRYRYLLDDGVEGNFERVAPHELHAKTLPVARRNFEDQEQEALSQFQALHGTGLGSADLSEVARAAVFGRVRTLMVARGKTLWGVFDRTTGEVSKHERQKGAHDDDLLDDVAEAVLTRGGQVLVLEPDRMPGAEPLAAVLRW